MTSQLVSERYVKAYGGPCHTVVPYGTAALTNDPVGGHVRIGFKVLASALGSVQSGDLRLTATSGRTMLFSDVPTVIEQGAARFRGRIAPRTSVPACTATDTIAQINRALLVAIGSPDLRARIIADGDDPHWSSPHEYASDIDRDAAKWSALIRRLNLRVE
jgi:tripartite-type tricarboxylate transporter receptor subunit TctC